MAGGGPVDYAALAAMSRLGAWIQASRPLAQANLAGPLAFGQGLALAGGLPPSVAMAAVAFGFGVVDQLVIVWMNDVADEPDDRLHSAPTPFSGGSRVLVEGRLTAAALTRGAWLAAVALLLLAAAAAMLAGRVWLPPLALAALGLAWAYSCPPLRRSARGGGEWLQAAGIGVVLPLVGWHAQSGAAPGLESFPWAALLPAIALGYAGHVATAIPDAHADALAGRRTLAVRLGQARAALLTLQVLTLATFGTALVLPRAGQTTWLTLELLALAAALPAWSVWRRNSPFAAAAAPRSAAAAGHAGAVGTPAGAPWPRRDLLVFVGSTGAATQVLWWGWAALLLAA